MASEMLKHRIAQLKKRIALKLYTPSIDDIDDLEYIKKVQTEIWTGPERRALFNRNGFDIAPMNFYSSHPSIEEIIESFEYKLETPYLLNGLFDRDYLLKNLNSLIPFAQEFTAPNEGDAENAKSFFWGNSEFTYADALSYYALIRKYKPSRIIEVGSGFSSLVAKSALQKNGKGELWCIEPFPRPFLKNVCDQLVQRKAQELDINYLNDSLKDGDFLFIDSTHTVKIGSDCLNIYLRLLPSIKKNILVHVHDVFLPNVAPKNWAIDNRIYWTEAYLLLAFLIDNPKIKIEWGSEYHRIFNLKLLHELMIKNPPPNPFKGGSFWFWYHNQK